MAITVDNKQLNVISLKENFEVIHTSYEEIREAELKRYVKVYGVKRQWEISAVEQNVSWMESILKYLQDKAAAGSLVTLKVEETDYNVEASVYVVEASLNEFDPKNKIKYFTVTFVEY